MHSAKATIRFAKGNSICASLKSVEDLLCVHVCVSLVGEGSIGYIRSGCNGNFVGSDCVYKGLAILENLWNREFRRARGDPIDHLSFVLIAVMAENLNVGNMICATFATGYNVIIFQIERATAPTAAFIVLHLDGLPEVLLSLRDLGHLGDSLVGERSIGGDLGARQA